MLFSYIAPLTLLMSLVFCVLVLCQPLVRGILRALKVFFVPIKPKEERRGIARANLRNELTRMANSSSRNAPNMAAELMQMSCRM